MSSPGLHEQLSMVKLGNGLSIINTRFGPCLVGRAPEVNVGNWICNVSKVSILPEPEPESTLREHLQCELAGISTDVVGVLKNEEDIQFDEKMKTTLIQDADGRLEVEMPWKGNPDILLENNKPQAVQRDMALQRKLLKDPYV